jgi:phosphopantetheinyl transferase
VVIGEFMRTMEQLIDTQGNVMSAFLKSARHTGPERAPSALPPGEPGPAGRLDAPGPGIDLDRRDASRPLGNGDRTSLDLARPVEASLNRGGSSISSADIIARQTEVPSDPGEARRRLLEVVSQRTGYPVGMLDPCADLEADLGIDSIKRVEILGSLARTSKVFRFSPEEFEQVTRLRTIEQILALAMRRRPPVPTWRADLPFIGTVIRHRAGEEVVATRTLDMDADDFLRDHTLGPRISEWDPGLNPLPVLPFALSLEMMAEAASLLMPGAAVIGLRDVRALRWIVLESTTAAVEVLACRRAGESGEVAVQIRSIPEGGHVAEDRPLLVEGIICFGSPMPLEPPGSLVLRQEQPSPWKPDELYAAGARHGMFHGRLFQGVASLERLGENGAEATLRFPVPAELRDAERWVDLMTSPLELDSAGQVLGFWAADRLKRGFVVFPVGLGTMRLGLSAKRPTGRMTCRVHVTDVAESCVRADLEVVDGEGTARLRVLNWEVKRFDLPERFYAFRLNPADELASVPWAEPLAHCPDREQFRCCRAEFPPGFLEGNAGIWQDVLAHLVLGRRERQVWRALQDTDQRRSEWLLGRVAAKDAVRLVLRDSSGLRIYPADLDIDLDGQGRASPRWARSDQVGGATLLAIAHSHGMAVAIAAKAEGVVSRSGLGIEVHRLNHPGPYGEETFLTADERGHLAGLEPDALEEWELRLWCSKQAAAKARGWGSMGGPDRLSVDQVAVPTGEVHLVAVGEPAQGVPDRASGPLKAWTHRQGNLIVAISY